MNKYIVLIIILGLISCNKQSTNKETSQSVETILIQTDRVESHYDLSPKVSQQFQIIPLETTDECIITEITQMLIQGNDIVISDKKTQRIYHFDISGKFLNFIGKLGGGPNEYSDLGAIEIIENELYLYDKGKHYICVYDLNGDFKRKVSDEEYYYSESMLYLNNRLYSITNYTQSDLGFYNLIKRDLTTNKIEGYCQFEKEISDFQQYWKLERYFSKNNNYSLFQYSNNDVIYSIDNDSVFPKYKIVFSERKIPDSEIKKGARSALYFALEKNYILGINSINDTDSLLLMRYSDNSIYDVVYDKKLRKCTTYNWLLFSHLGNLLVTNYHTYDNKLIMAQDAYMFRDAWERQYSQSNFNREENRVIMSNLYDRLSDDDNPVVFIFNFK